MRKALPLRGNFFYGWYVVAVALVANFMAGGSGHYLLNTFMQPLCIERGWTRTEISLGLMLGVLFGTIGQLINGTLVMRFGPRMLMLLGSFIAGTVFIFMGRVQDLRTFYLFFVLLFLGNSAYGGIVANTAVNNWFLLKRGKALGLATTGGSLSGAFLPLLALLLLEKTGLSQAFFVIGLAIMLLGPIAWMVVRNRPEDYGLSPDGGGLEFRSDRTKGPVGSLNGSKGISEGSKNMHSGTGWIQWTPSKIIREPAFWKIGFAFAMVIMGLAGIMSQLKPRFSDLGFEDRTAMIMMGSTALMGAVGKFAWGALCDRFEPRRIITLLMGLMSLGMCFSFLHRSLIALILFVIIFGFAMGGVMSTLPIIVADIFGRESFAAVARFLSIFMLIGMPGFIIASLSADLTGSYDAAYLLFMALDIMAACIILSVKRPVNEVRGFERER